MAELIEILVVDVETDAIVPTAIRMHDARECIAEWCPLHHPSPHPLAHAPIVWSWLDYFFLRQCAHGLHPDPDSIRHLQRMAGSIRAMGAAEHECPCGCCGS